MGMTKISYRIWVCLCTRNIYILRSLNGEMSGLPLYFK